MYRLPVHVGDLHHDVAVLGHAAVEEVVLERGLVPQHARVEDVASLLKARRERVSAPQRQGGGIGQIQGVEAAAEGT